MVIIRFVSYKKNLYCFCINNTPFWREYFLKYLDNFFKPLFGAHKFV